MLQLSHKTIQTIKTAFHIILITAITFQLLSKAFFSLPNDWLFFLTSGAVENFVFTLIAYLFYYFVLKLNGIWKKTGFVILFIIILIALAVLKEYRIHNSIAAQQTFEYFKSFLGLTLLFYLSIYFVNRLEYLNRYKKLEKELNQAKSQLLRQQFNPHFLFNAFNSLYSMSLKNHSKTPDTILKLSGMMRYLTDDTIINKVRLSKEIEFIEQYIAIEKIRFGEGSNINFNIEGNSNNVYIAPLLLVTFVENAFKHGFYTNNSNSFVAILMRISDTILEFEVKNSIQQKQHFQEETRKGKGLENVKERLKITYPKKHDLKIMNAENNFQINLKIELA
ncbi:hypothetical protein CW731_02750 [Polaribacter sp. ALD11]|uniref:sensor histidine kinase n=1 Tax=Polaribacter sp. ALD11 TaxID=2058137 RepID=UPI000C30B294|nr:histidine kinase [Polaribacter sp. ALD11]AUC84283.1 hypothetical protein CW731_02750 [Polaribacter sp. ALD11]